MWFGHFAEGFVPEGHWSIPLWMAVAIAYVGTWWGGIGCAIFNFRGLYRACETSTERPWHWADYVVNAGHLALALAFIHWVFGRVAGADLVYGALMLAALGYSVGLGALALTFRSKTDRPQAVGG